MAETDCPESLITIVWERRERGDLVADIGKDLGYTPLEVLEILRAERARREQAAGPATGATDPGATPAGGE